MTARDRHPTTQIRAALIDLDGTLLDTIEDIADAANGMLAALDRPVLSVDAVRALVGRGIPNLVGRCLGGNGEASPALLAEALTLFKAHYQTVNGRKARPYPGVREGLQSMRAAGLRLACVTNKSAAFTDPLLERAGLLAFFELTVSGDTLAERKPHPAPFLHACRILDVAPAAAVVIGDSRNDIAAARAAGCPVLCVPYGYSEGEDVRKLDADGIVATLEEAARHVCEHNARIAQG